MVAIFTGAGAGFQRGSANILGGAGQLGTALLGRGSENVSVNAATGNLLISHQDEFLVGLGPDAGISRTYNSLQDAEDRDNGDHWQQSTTRRVFGVTGALGAAGSAVSRLSGDGSVIVYRWDDARSAYVTTDGAGAFDTLTEAGGIWTWTDGDSRVSETYEADGAGSWRVTAQTDADGNALSFTYSGDKLDKVTTADGGWTQYVWTGSNITEIVTGFTDLGTGTPETLTRVRYAYDGSDRLASVTTDLSPGDGAVSDGNIYTVAYTYDGASHRLATIAQSDGSHLAIAYDTSGRVETLTQTVASGVTRVTALTYGSGHTEVTGPEGAVTRLDYDAKGQLTKVTAPPAAAGAAPQEVLFAYDADGNVTSITNGNGKVTQYDHDTFGNVTLVTDANGNSVQRTYDSANRLITELAYGLDESGVSAAHYTQYAYDAEGHLRFLVNAAGQVTEHEYNASGQLLRTTRYPGHVYAVGPAPVDEAGMEAWLAGLGGLGLIQVTENSYDVRGGLTSTTSYSDFGINRVDNSEFAGTDGWLIGYDPYVIADGAPYIETWNDQPALSLNVTTTTASQVISLATPLGSIALSGGERISVQTGLELSGVVTGAQLVAHYFDENMNHLGGAEVAIISGNQPAGTTLAGFLDVPQNAAKMRFELYAFTSGVGTGSFGLTEPMVAQATAEQIAVPEYTPGLGGYTGEGFGLSSSFSRSRYLYDQSGRLLERHNEGEASETFVYDGMGRVIASTDVHSGTTTFVFNDAATTTTVTTALGHSTVSVFNKAGELLSEMDSGAHTAGGTSTYQYDANGRLRALSVGGSPNLIPDSSFEDQGSYDFYHPQYASASVDTTVARSYGKSLRAEVVALGGEGHGHSYARHVNLNVQPTTQPRTFSVWVRGEAGTRGFIRMTGGINGAMQWGGGSSLDHGVWFEIAETDVWQRVSVTLDANAAVNHVQLRFGFANSGDISVGDVLHFDDIQLENGRAPTLWQPADPNGPGTRRTSYFHYDDAGRKVADINHLGQITEYRYDAADRLVATVNYATALGAAELTILANPNNTADIASLLPAPSADDVWSWNVYDDGGRLVQVIDNLGGTVAYEYDASDRLVRTTAYAASLTSTQLDALKVALPAAPVPPASDPADVISRMFYNGAGQLIAALDGEGFLTETVYDGAGQAVQTFAYATATLPADRANGSLDTLRSHVAGSSLADRVSHSVYDGQGLLRFTVDALGAVTGFDYDAAGRLTNTTSYAVAPELADFTYPALKAALATDPGDRRSWTVYDDAGRAAYSVDAAGGVVAFDYDAQGRLIKTVSYANLRGTTAAPTLGDLNGWTSDVAQANDQENRVSRSFYSERGELLYSVDALGYVTGFTYDAEGRVLAETAYGGQNGLQVDDATTTAALESMLSAIGDSITTSRTYDGAGRVLTTTDGEGFITRNVYDALGRLTDIYRADGTAGEVRTHYRYDGAGRVVEQFSAYGTVNEISTHFAYDGLGNQIATTDPNGNVTTYEYDRLGRLRTVTNALNGITTYAYDASGNVVKVTDPNGGETYSHYDVLGRLAATRDAEGYVTRHAYNRFGELVSTERYAKPMTGPGETGVVFFDAANMPPEGVDPFDYAAQLQAIADDLDGQADAAEAALPGLSQTAANAAQAAIDADAVVTALEAQIAALGGGGPIDFETERTAALADVANWLDDRENWLRTARDATYQLIAGTSGLEYTLLQAHYSRLGNERSLVDRLSSRSINPIIKEAYVNHYYDSLSWRADNLGIDRAAALSSSTSWLQSYADDLENWINGLQTIDGMSWNINAEGAYREMQVLWSNVFAAIYDIQENTYSNGWPIGNWQINSWYLNVQINPNYVPSNITHTAQHSPDHRATTVINAFFDVQDTIGYEGGGVDPTLLALQAQLGQAQIDAGEAHDANNAAQLALTNGQTSATDLRAQAVQAQIDADSALVTAQSGVTNRDNFVLIDLSTLGRGAASYSSYDKLGRVVQSIDAEGFVETYSYNAFGQLTEISRYEKSVYPEAELPPTVLDAYEAANDLKAEADGMEADAKDKDDQADSIESGLGDLQDDVGVAQAEVSAKQSTVNNIAAQMAAHPANALFTNPVPYLQAYRDEVAQEAAYWYSVASSASMADPLYEEYWYLYDFYLTTKNDIEAEITRVQSGQPLSPQGQTWAMYGGGLSQAQINNYTALKNQHWNAVEDLGEAQAELAAAQTALGNAQQSISNLRAQATTLRAQADVKYGEAEQAYQAAEQLEEALSGGLEPLPQFDLGSLGSEAETEFAYDNRGQLTSSTDAAGFHESYGYDGYGRRISATAKSFSASSSASGGTTSYVYDKRGLLLTETLPVQAYSSAGQALGPIVQSYEYDERGNLLRRVEAVGLPEERITEYEYDELDRLTATRHDMVSGVTINPESKTVSAVSGRPQEITIYDANGNVIESHDAAGAKTVFFYDELNRKTVEINALGTYTAYNYDANGNVTRISIYETTVAVPSTGGKAADAPSSPSGARRETVFTYDHLGRLIDSSVLGATTGYHLSGWNSSSEPITTSYVYDYQGNTVRVIDPNGNATVANYDRLGRKVEQVDAGGYRTRWSYDANGNVLEEVRYATQGVVPSGNRIFGLPAIDAANDRVTQYTYDEMGNRLTETRLNVKVHNGSGAHSTVNSTISYAYNGLGQVVSKTEATGDQTHYVYDAGGRLMTETREGFVSFNGQTVTPAVDYGYDGLGNLVRTTEAGGGGVAARITRYEYGAGGRLAELIDAEGNSREFLYDVAGRLVFEHYDRTVANTNGTNTVVHEGIGYRYDLLGRNLGQAYYTGSAWQFQAGNGYTTTDYNAFGDVIGVAFNRGSAAIAAKGWQQQNQYDLAGRLIGSNAGDGLWKYYGYDRNGNLTVTIASGGANLSGKTFDQALSMVGQENVIATYAEYDSRNLAVRIIEEDRQLSEEDTVDLVTGRTFNAFGEIASETDALGHTTYYGYNTMGRLIEEKSPQVEVWSESGAMSLQRPTQHFYYDASGRVVAQRDANSNLTKWSLLAGTGYGDAEALIAQTIQPGNGTLTTQYDIHGNARKITDQIGRVTNQTFDQLGQVVTVARQGAAVQNYSYDQLGRQVKHWNGVYGAGEAEITTFDVQGRVVGNRQYGGEVTVTSYAWNDTATTSTIGNFGGWIATETADGYTNVTAADIFGRQAHSDFTYDAAGRVTRDKTDANVSGEILYQYYNTGQLKYKNETGFVTRVVNGFLDTTSKEVWLSYDELGRLKTERLSTHKIENFEYDSGAPGEAAYWTSEDFGQVFQDSTASYDALGRLAQVTDNFGDFEKRWAYDANGNVRKIEAQQGTSSVTTEWYRYDALNRVTLAKGELNNGVIQRGADGVEMTYDAASQRKTARIGSSAVEYYTYNDLGLVTEVRIGSAGSNLRVTSSYDALGRIEGHVEKDAGGSVVYERFDIDYSARNQVLKEKGKVKQGSSWVYSHTVNYYNDTGHSSIAADPPLISSPNATGTSTGDLLAFSRTKYGTLTSSGATLTYGSSADNAMTDSADEHMYMWHEDKGFLRTSTDTTNQYGSGSLSQEYDGAGNIVDADRTNGP